MTSNSICNKLQLNTYFEICPPQIRYLPKIKNNEFTFIERGDFKVNNASNNYYFNGYPNMLIPGYNGEINVPGNAAICNEPY